MKSIRTHAVRRCAIVIHFLCCKMRLPLPHFLMSVLCSLTVVSPFHLIVLACMPCLQQVCDVHPAELPRRPSNSTRVFARGRSWPLRCGITRAVRARKSFRMPRVRLPFPFLPADPPPHQPATACPQPSCPLVQCLNPHQVSAGEGSLPQASCCTAPLPDTCRHSTPPVVRASVLCAPSGGTLWDHLPPAFV